MKLILSRQDEITCHSIKASFKGAQERADLKWVCEWIKKNQDRFNIELLSKELGVEESYAKVLHKNLQDLEIIKREKLTDMGRQVAKSGIAYIAEEGVYNVWLIQDRFYLKHDGFDFIAHWEPKKTIGNERNLITKNKKIGSKITSLIDNKRSANSWNIEVIVESHKDFKSTVDIEWVISLSNDDIKDGGKEVEQKIYLKGDLKGCAKGKKKEFEKEIHPSFKITVHELLKIINPYFEKEFRGWDSSKHGLKVEFDNNTKTERLSFIKDCEDFEPTYKKIKFNFSLKDVPIVPSDDRQASEWLEWLVERKISEHMTPGEINQIVEDMKYSTPLSKFRAKFDMDKKRDRYWKDKDKRFWYMSASKDFGNKDSETPIIFTKEKLSYFDAVDRLFPGIDFAEQNKLVYMDRHASEKHNIRNMELLIESIQEKDFQGEFILITSEKGDDNLSDITVKHYKEIYDDTWPPHGRYFLAKSNTGIHMFELTHNLVHPRIDKKDMVIWADISSFEVPIDRIKSDPIRSELLRFVEKR